MNYNFGLQSSKIVCRDTEAFCSCCNSILLFKLHRFCCLLLEIFNNSFSRFLLLFGAINDRLQGFDQFSLSWSILKKYCIGKLEVGPLQFWYFV